jgi:hypothetical protein
MSTSGNAYHSINQQWDDTTLPQAIYQTPNWQAGWLVIGYWVMSHDDRITLSWWDSRPPRRYPYSQVEGYDARWELWENTWAREVHIWSHCLPHGGGVGHSLQHAKVEAEGTRLILAWWADLLLPSNVVTLGRRLERARRLSTAKGEVIDLIDALKLHLTSGSSEPMP